MSASASMLRTPLYPLTAVFVSTGVLVAQNHFYHRRCMRSIERLGRELHAGGVQPITVGAIEHEFPFIGKIVDGMDEEERDIVKGTAHIVELFQQDPGKFWESARKTLLDKISEEKERRAGEEGTGESSGTRRKVPISVIDEPETAT